MSSPECSGALEVFIEPGRGLCVEFRKFGDRFGHEILLIFDDKRISVLRSAEGSERHENPRIPCFQELHQQGQTLFLTGATEVGHWSMCVQVGEARFLDESDAELVDRQATFQYLSFDVACRIKKATHPIGSEYQKAEDFDSYLSGDMGSSPDSSLPSFNLLARNPRMHSLLLDPQPDCSIVHTDATNLRLFSQHDLPEELPSTVQWCYGAQAM